MQAKHIHVDVQRAAIRCLCLFALLDLRPSPDLVTQLRLSFINGPGPVSAMACKALIDLATWHGPHEADKLIGLDLPHADDGKTHFTSVNISEIKEDDLSIGVLDLLFSGFRKYDWEASTEHDDYDNIQAILGEGFAKILLMSKNYPSIPSHLHPLILSKLINLFFCDETKELQRLSRNQ